MQGHVPFDPRCTLCARGKSVLHHRRRRANMLETEVQADFAFLTTRGEVVSEDAPGTIKVLVLTELSSGCIGYVVVESDVSKVRTQICRWLEHFGLTSTTTGVILHTDAERAVAVLVGKSSERYTFNVRRANPQQHQSVGAAERAVRRLKERSFGVACRIWILVVQMWHSMNQGWLMLSRTLVWPTIIFQRSKVQTCHH